jgi:uncharacterized protein
MPEYKSPGVYIEEFDTGPVPITGVGTSTAGFIGPTERGPISPQHITSLPDYRRTFGDVASTSFQEIDNPQESYLMYAVDGFFSNGGSECYIARVTAEGAVRAAVEINGTTVRASGPGEWGNNVQVTVEEGLGDRFSIVVDYWKDGISDEESAEQRRYDDLSVNEGDPDYYAKRVNNASALIEINEGAEDPFPVGEFPLGDGDDGGNIGVNDFKGGETQVPTPSRDPGENRIQRTGLEGFKEVDSIAIVCAPDERPVDGLTGALIEHCEDENLRDRFAVLQARQGITPDGLIEQFNQGNLSDTVSDRGYTALYYPWIKVIDPTSNTEKLVPPGGHVAGVYARTDNERGVHKAPANEPLRGTRGLEHEIRKEDQDGLNPLGINCIRVFRGRGIRVWGARTTSPNVLWRYVNVRRLFIFLEESIQEGTQWAVFEPNDEPLWARIRQSVSNFLTIQWRNGALQGTTPEEAFYVKCDRTTMTQDDIDQGRLICEIGVAPVKPAEFVIFRITQWTAGAQGA